MLVFVQRASAQKGVGHVGQLADRRAVPVPRLDDHLRELGARLLQPPQGSFTPSSADAPRAPAELFL